jgi:hypothetical protein
MLPVLLPVCAVAATTSFNWTNLQLTPQVAPDLKHVEKSGG